MTDSVTYKMCLDNIEDLIAQIEGYFLQKADPEPSQDIKEAFAFMTGEFVIQARAAIKTLQEMEGKLFNDE